MQFLPESADLLGAIARLLDEQVLGVVPGELQHQVRVAAHLSRLLEREARLGAAAVGRERELLNDLLGAPVEDPVTMVADRLRTGEGVDEAFERRVWDALVEITRHDLAICKPGHESWTGT